MNDAAAFGVTGLPVGVKEQGQRSDFRPDAFIVQIEKHGYRLAWTRAALCPCVPLNGQTQQSDPNCAMCRGSGYYYFGPATPQPAADQGVLNAAQAALIAKQNAFVCRAIMTGLGSQTQPWERFGGWRSGQSVVTTRPQNRLGYMDRMVALDSYLTYREVVVAIDGATLPTRYIVDGAVYLVCDQAFVRYVQGVDFDVLAGGIVWLPGGQRPTVGTRLALHYETHPTWMVTSFPHTVRNTYIDAKTQFPTTPAGNPYDLPMQATVQLEFLVGSDERLP